MRLLITGHVRLTISAAGPRDVDRLASRREAFPPVQHVVRGADHRVGHQRDALAVERGLRQAPLT
jgi:hypothetical protein